MKSFQADPRIYNQLRDPLGDNQYLTDASAINPGTASHGSDKDDTVDPDSIVVRNTIEVV